MIFCIIFVVMIGMISWGCMAPIPQYTCLIAHNAPLWNRNVLISFPMRCIVGYGTGAFWGLWNWLYLEIDHLMELLWFNFDLILAAYSVVRVAPLWLCYWPQLVWSVVTNGLMCLVRLQSLTPGSVDPSLVYCCLLAVNIYQTHQHCHDLLMVYDGLV